MQLNVTNLHVQDQFGDLEALSLIEVSLNVYRLHLTKLTIVNQMFDLHQLVFSAEI